MKISKPWHLGGIWICIALAGVIFNAAPVHGTNVYWTGPDYTYSHGAYDSSADMITTNHVGADSANNVFLSRDVNYPLYNAAAESGWNGTTSPLNTMWAVASGPLTNAATLTYDTFYNVVGHPGDSPGNRVGLMFYVKIVSDNIYFSLTLTEWGNNDGGSFSYTRSTPAVAAVAVTLTNPVAGTVLAAPASLKLGASVTGGSATVTNVQFFANTTSLGSVGAAPFILTSGNLNAGAYGLTAVATAAGISTTSAVVNVTVVNPVTNRLSQAQILGGQFNFNYSANPGLSYFVQASSNLVNWSSLITNVAVTSSVSYSAALAHTGSVFYRVGRVPNP